MAVHYGASQVPTAGQAKQFHYGASQVGTAGQAKQFHYGPAAQ